MTALRTTCRVCEAACGLVAEVQGGRVVRLRPDPEHPVSRGFACVKGTRYAERVAAHPERVVRPRVRVDGAWVEVGWGQALRAVGARIRPLLDRYGPDAVGLFSGNAAGHDLGAVLGVAALQRGLGTRRHYSCLTLDNSEMFVVAEEVFGDPLHTFVADYAGSDCVVLVGTDPLASMASQAQSHPRGPVDLRERARAGQLVVVDPRSSVTAAAAARHLRPRVGTDVFLLAWLLGAALPRAPDPALAAAVAPFDRARVERVTGIAAADLDALRDRLLGAARPLVWSGLGVLLSAHGTLGWWLTVALQATLGGLDRAGGWVRPATPVDLSAWLRRLGVRGRDPRVVGAGGRPAILGTLPAATLADDALSGELRALIVVGGDPASSLPDTGRAARALERLEVVGIDLFASATARFAGVWLPAATWLERDEVALHVASQRATPHLRLDRAVVPPPGEAREDFAILVELCRALGRRPFGSLVVDLALRAGLGPTAVARAVTAWAGVRWSEVASAGGSLATRVCAPIRPRLAVPEWCEALRTLPDPEPALRLVTSVRPIGSMNHWLRAEPGPPTVLAHPDDLPPGRTTLRSEVGEVEVVVAADPALPRGTVVFPFGHAGANPNALVGTAELEAYTGQPASNGAPVAAGLQAPLR